MIPLLLRALVVIAICWWLLVLLGFLPPLFSRTVIRIRDGHVRIAGAALSPRAKQHLEDVVRETGLSSGFIALSKRGQVGFSRSIPKALRQRLRNILLN